MSEKSNEDSFPLRRKRRRVVYVSEVDQRLIDHGLEPSWEQKVSMADIDLSGGGLPSSNDERLRNEVPPHWHARA